jgi:hypothetical protein
LARYSTRNVRSKKILLSADSSEIATIIEDSKGKKNGIRKMARKQKELKEKYHYFIKTVVRFYKSMINIMILYILKLTT